MLITSVCVCVCACRYITGIAYYKSKVFLKYQCKKQTKKNLHFNLKIGVKFDIIIQLSAILNQSKCTIHLFNKQ